MSSPSSASTRAVLDRLLATEKAATRDWLQSHFSTLIYPLVESLFDKIKAKLDNYLQHGIEDQTATQQKQSRTSQLTNQAKLTTTISKVPWDSPIGSPDDDPAMSPYSAPSSPQVPIGTLSSAFSSTVALYSTRLITLSLGCFESTCSSTFTDIHQLHAHLVNVHSIQRFRCFVRDCKQSFDKNNAFSEHFKTSHPEATTTTWDCSGCDKTFRSYNTMANHHRNLHQTGQFQCAHPNCGHVETVRADLYLHIRRVHKNQQQVQQQPEVVTVPWMPGLDNLVDDEEVEVQEKVQNQTKDLVKGQEKDKDQNKDNGQSKLLDQSDDDDSTTVYDDDVQWIDDGDDDVLESRPAKRQRTTDVQPKVPKQVVHLLQKPQQSSSLSDTIPKQATTESRTTDFRTTAQPKQFKPSNIEESITNRSNRFNRKPVITLGLKCRAPPAANCHRMFENGDQLDRHMKEEHEVGKFRCELKGCSASFDVETTFQDHLQSAHLSTNKKLFCSYCPKHCMTYPKLSAHISSFHHLGTFKCSHPSCGFIAECSEAVSDHHSESHPIDLMCQFCGVDFKYVALLKAHERIHLGIQPFRCKWEGCNFRAVSRRAVTSHVRATHFRQHDRQREPGGDAQHFNVNDFVQVVEDDL